MLSTPGTGSAAEFEPEFDVRLIRCCSVDPINSP